MTVIVAREEPTNVYLDHSGLKGMKWGIRRWQNEDGTLTPAGRERYGVGKGKTGESESSGSEQPAAKKTIRQTMKERRAKNKEAKAEAAAKRKEARTLSDEELQNRINRLNKEKQYAQLLQEREEREDSPLHREATKLLQDTMKQFAQKSMTALVDSTVDSIKGKLKDKSPTLEKYMSADINKLTLDQIKNLGQVYEAANKIVQNRPNVNDTSPTAQKKIKNQPKNQNEPSPNADSGSSNNNSNNGTKLSKGQKKQIKQMQSSGKSVSDIASSLGITEERVKQYLGASGG